MITMLNCNTYMYEKYEKKNTVIDEMISYKSIFTISNNYDIEVQNEYVKRMKKKQWD